MPIKCRPLVAALAVLSLSGAARATTLFAPYASDYNLQFFGTPSGLPGNLGGITFLDHNTILVGGNANIAAGEIDAVPVLRDVNGQITGFGAATLYSTAPFIDGGLAFAPDGTLYFTGYPVNQISAIAPGCSVPCSPAATFNLTGAGPQGVGTINVVPAGFAGAGTAIVGDYVGGGWYSVASTLGPLTLAETTGGGPEGIVWVAAGAKDFAVNRALISLHMLGEVDACLVDSFGAPTGCVPFMTGLLGAEGAAIDPVTGDFLFTTFQAGNQIAVVSLNPEPAAVGLVGLGLLGLFCLGHNRKHKARPAGGC